MSTDISLIGKKFLSHHSVAPIEYTVTAEDEKEGFYIVESKSGNRIMDVRILKPMILQKEF